MIYIVRRTPFGRQTVWRLEGGSLIEGGKTVRELPLADLRSARIMPPGARRGGAASLTLSFRNRAVAIGARHFDKPFRAQDQTRAFAAFARAVLAQAAKAAPGARYEAAAGQAAGLYFGAMGMLAIGLALILVATFTAHALTLGLELASRLSFVLILMFAAWPWVGRLQRRAFDPSAVPVGLLP